MLSRPESGEHVYILDKLNPCKVYASDDTLGELSRMEQISINKNLSAWETCHDNTLKVFVLNIGGLKSKFAYLKSDPMIYFADVILLSETWIDPNYCDDNQFL